MIGRRFDSIFDQVSATLMMSNSAQAQVAAMDCKNDTNDDMLLSSFPPIDELLSSPILCISKHDLECGDNNVEKHSFSKGHGRFLESTFVPGGWDVLCGRGKQAFDHIGNRRLRILVASKIKEYAQGTRHEKSIVVRSIVEQIQEAANNSPHNGGGGFVRKDRTTNQWIVLDTSSSIEKVGHVFRDLLRESHKKSSKLTAKEKELSLRDTQDNIFKGMYLLPAIFNEEESSTSTSTTSQDDTTDDVKKDVVSNDKDTYFEIAFEKLRAKKKKCGGEGRMEPVSMVAPDGAFSSCSLFGKILDPAR